MSEYEPRPFVESGEAIAQSDCALALKINGTDIKGGIIGGVADGLIKVTQWENMVVTSREKGSGLATGRRQYHGIHMVGPISKAAPLLFKALCMNEKVEGVLKCWRQKKDGGGKENHFNLKFKDCRIADYLVFTSPLDGSLFYQFRIVFHEIEYEWVDGGVTHTDTWSHNA